jgi:hypothetical protein
METKNEVLKELEELSPRLAAMRKSNPFSVPEGYFTSLQGQIIAAYKAQSVDAELTETPQLQAQHAQENPFTVPYGYFENFSGKMLEKVKHEKTTPVKRIQEYLQYSIRPVYSLAALPIAALLVIAIILFKPQHDNSSSTVAQATLTSQDIQAYLSSNVTSIDEQSIAEQITIQKGKPLIGQADTKLEVNDPSLIDVSNIDLSSIENL